MIDLLKPELTVERPPSDPDTSRYVRSYLILRVLLGSLGVALPFLLVLGDGLLFDGDPFPRTSLSAYYYSVSATGSSARSARPQSSWSRTRWPSARSTTR